MPRPTCRGLPAEPLDPGLDFLAVGAHPDDVELGVGGILAKLAAEGYRTGIVDLTEGEKGTRGTREIRREESAAAAKILKVAARVNAQFPDTRVHDSDEGRQKVAWILRLLRPRLVITHHANCRNPDHIGASELVERSCMQAGLGKFLEETDAPPPWRPDRVLFFGGWHHREPSAIVDITEHIETKVSACFAHKSQFFNPDSNDPETLLSNPLFEEWLRSRANLWGFRIGVEYAEPITVKGYVPVRDPVETFLGTPW